MSAAASLERQRTEIVSRIQAAANEALESIRGGADVPVHRFERFAARDHDLRRFYVIPVGEAEDGGRGLLVGWHVRHVATLELEHDASHTRAVRRWRALAVMALDDPGVAPSRVAEDGQTQVEASEIVFDRMLECVRAKFRDDDALFETPDHGGDGALLAETTRYEGRQGFQIDDSGPAMFAGVLCHVARCSVVTVCSEPVGIEATGDFARAGLDLTHFDQSQRYLDGTQADVGARVPPAGDPDSDFEDVSSVREGA